MEAIWKRARDDVIVGDEPGQEDVFLWEHSARVARSALMVADLPGAASRRLDRDALIAAALYHDAGWVCQFREGLINRNEVLCRPTNDLQRELGAGLLAKRLAQVLKAQSLDTAVTAVRQAGTRDNTLLESQILVEADNLDEIGALFFWQIVRRNSNDGRGVQAAIETWQRQKEYKFWDARIADSFRFEPVRRLARQRLKHFEQFMDELVRQHGGEDVAQLAGVDSAWIEQHMPSQAGTLNGAP